MKIYTTGIDEKRVERIRVRALRPLAGGSAGNRAPKWWVLRLALAISLRQSFPPADARRDDEGKEYDLAQVTGHGKSDSDDPDLTDAIRAIISVYQKDDLFSEHTRIERQELNQTAEKRFLELLLAHIQRGLEVLDDAINRGEGFERFLLSVLLSDVESRTEVPSNDRADEIVGRLLDQGIRAQLQEIRRGPRVETYLLKLGGADALVRMRARIDELAFAMGLPEGQLDVVSTPSPLVAALYVPRASTDWDVYTGDDLLGWVTGEVRGEDLLLPVWLGVTVEGRPYVLDLTEAPHLLVAGTTGSGKSACLHSVIASLVLTKKPADLHLTLIDPKRGIEFSSYASIPHLHGGKISKSAPDARQRLGDLVAELEMRNEKIAQAGASSLAQARREGSLSLPWRVVVIDELADLVLSDPEIEAPLVRLAQMGRAAGIHLVVATQRPDAKILSGLLRSNIPSRIAFKVAKAMDSQIIIDGVGAERLLGKGDMLARVGSAPLARLQGLLLDANGIRKILKHIERD